MKTEYFETDHKKNSACAPTYPTNAATQGKKVQIQFSFSIKMQKTFAKHLSPWFVVV